MPYVLAEESFSTKNKITTRCREILNATPDGNFVSEDILSFLMELFQHHDEWPQKSAGGILGISTQTTSHGTRCFVLLRKNGDTIDISFPHAIRLISSNRSNNLIPQALRDFRNAARNGVETQIWEFRDCHLTNALACPITGEKLNRDNCAVDHMPPTTFDSLLFNFCQINQINPLSVTVGSKNGTIAVFEDAELLAAWQDHHRSKASLRLVSRVGNLQLPKMVIPWNLLYQKGLE